MRGGGGAGAAGANEVEHAFHEAGAEDGFAIVQADDGFDEALGVHLFHEVAVRAGDDGLMHEVVVGEGGEHEDARVGVLLEYGAAGGETVPVGQAYVEQHDIGAGFAGTDDGLGHAAGLADDLELGLRVVSLEQAAHAAANEGAVIDKQQADDGRDAGIGAGHTKKRDASRSASGGRGASAGLKISARPGAEGRLGRRECPRCASRRRGRGRGGGAGRGRGRSGRRRCRRR